MKKITDCKLGMGNYR